MIRSTPAKAAAWKTLARASRFGPMSSSQGARSSGFAARWTTVSTPWKWVIQSSSRIARSASMISGSSLPGLLVDQDQVIDVGPGRAELAADVAACAGDQDGARLLIDLLGEEVLVDDRLFLVLIVVRVVSELAGIGIGLHVVSVVDRQVELRRPPRFAGLILFIMIGRLIGMHLQVLLSACRIVLGLAESEPGIHTLAPTSLIHLVGNYPFGTRIRDLNAILHGTLAALDSPDGSFGRLYERTLSTASRKKKSPHITDSSTPSFLWM